MEERFFSYGEKEINWLAARDPVLGEFIARTGMIKRRLHPNAFTGLLHAITGQQLSSKAHASIWKRFLAANPGLDPAALAGKHPDEIKSCGISASKAVCVVELAAKVANGELPLERLGELPEDEIASKLGAIRGIGPWTIEMLLIFSYAKKNVLSFGDLALKKGMCNLYSLDSITREVFAEKQRLYAPYGTIAAFYLWECAVK